MRAGWDYHHVEAQSELSLLALANQLCILTSPQYNVAFPDIRATHRALVDLDSDLDKWTENLNERFAFSRFDSKSTAALKNYDVYNTHIAAVIWNSYRTIRIQANEQILRYAQLIIYSSRTTPGDGVTTSQVQALGTMSKLAEEICYSVPYFLDRSVWARDESKRIGNEITMYGGSAIIVPLSLAANEEWVSPRMYQWMASQIGRITESTGIGRANQY